MPICTREGFDCVRQKKNETFSDNEYVFFCEVTKEIFRDYEDYFRHVMAINSTVWQCEATGRDNLTYAEALKSERKARMKMEQFKDSLRPVVMLIIEHAKQSSIKNLNAITCKFLRRRYFLCEEVTACHNSNTFNPYKVLQIIPPDGTEPSDIVYELTDDLLYRLQSIGKDDPAITVPFDKIRRLRHEFTIENLAMFIKDSVIRVDGILRPKPAVFKKYVTDRNITFEKLFIGKMPHYTPSKIKPKSVANDMNDKKQSTMNKYLVKGGGGEKNNKVNSQEQTEEEKAAYVERAEAKAKSLKEEMERLRLAKQEKLLKLERLRAEKRERLIERVEKECTELLQKTDDLERSDQRLLPRYATLRTYIPIEYIGDAFMLREFMHSFSDILSGIEVFRNKLSFHELSRACTMPEVAGPLSDILLVLLGTIFDLQKEEEENCSVQYKKQASKKHLPTNTLTYVRRHFSYNLNQLYLDAQTASEVLRLHLLSSGAEVRERAEKWRALYRNGYVSSEDPGAVLRIEMPHILRFLKVFTIYQLPFRDIWHVINCLIAQILTYSTSINLIDERMEQKAKARAELRMLATTEHKRLAQVQMQKKALTCEYNQQCMETDIKDDPDKKKRLEDKLNKKMNELLSQSKREERKYDLHVEKLNTLLFDYMVYLGSDRAYRKYYVFESMPGIFVEHAPDCMDKCLEKPPVNSLESKLLDKSTLPKNRKDLRAYLLRMYTEEEKKAANGAKLQKNKKDTQENKENQDNQVTNGTAETPGSEPLTNGDVEKIDIDADVPPPAPPTQYQLYMCTGDPKNCIVHDEHNADRQRWAYMYDNEDIDALINALNPLGERESQLLKQLQTLGDLIKSHTQNCPVQALSLEDNKKQQFKRQMLNETYRKNSNFGFPENTDINDVMSITLVDRILKFETDVYTGDLGRLKVKDMEKWRLDLQQDTYDSQIKLQWGPLNQKLATDVDGEEVESGADDEVDDEEENIKDCGKYANKPYLDPGFYLEDDTAVKSEEHAPSDDIKNNPSSSEDIQSNPSSSKDIKNELPPTEDRSKDGLSLYHPTDEMRRRVRNLSCALLQIEQGIERRFLKEPFGLSLKDIKDKEVMERKLKLSSDRLRQWEVSLMESTSYSQIFLHLSILHDSIMWARSTNKSSCQVCRRGSEPDKMLLCDHCNGGTHTFCMKPIMKTVPEGNWYCKRCVTQLGLKNEPTEESPDRKKTDRKRKRESLVDEEENQSVTSSVSSASTSRTIGRRVSVRQSSKRLQPNEIAELLVEEADNENDEDEGDELQAEENDDEDDYGEEQESYIDEDTLDEDQELNATAENSESSSQTLEGEEDETESQEANEDGEMVCVECSYDGGDVTCSRCQDCFHLECIDLKRPPRYNFICSKCKTKEIKRRKRANDSDYEEETTKRSRQHRTSQRNSFPSSSFEDNLRTSTNGRRSKRRTAENLPLNSPALYELLEDVIKQEHAWPFLRPVLQSEVPDYYKIIKSPMDLAKVKSKLNMGAYQLNEEVLRDIQLIFQNCDTYNREGNEIYDIGSSLEKFVMQRCRELNLPYNPSDMNA